MQGAMECRKQIQWESLTYLIMWFLDPEWPILSKTETKRKKVSVGDIDITLSDQTSVNILISG